MMSQGSVHLSPCGCGCLCVAVWAPGLLGPADFPSAPDPENQIGPKRSPCLHTLPHFPAESGNFLPHPHFFQGLLRAGLLLPILSLAPVSQSCLHFSSPRSLLGNPCLHLWGCWVLGRPSPCPAPSTSLLSILLPGARLTQVLEGSVPCSALVPWAQHQAAGSEEGSTY